MNRQREAVPARRSAAGSTICACTETSSALTASSQHQQLRAAATMRARDADALVLPAATARADSGRTNAGSRPTSLSSGGRPGLGAAAAGRGPSQRVERFGDASRRRSCADRGWPNGSWNTTCTARRSGRIRVRRARRRSSLAAPDDATRCRADRRAAAAPRASVDLPQPLSPTTPSVPARPDVEVDTHRDRVARGRRCRTAPRGRADCDGQIARPAAARRHARPAPARRVAGDAAAAGAVPQRGASRGTLSVAAAQRGANAQPAAVLARVGRLAFDAGRRSPAVVEPRHRRRAGPRA